MARSPLFAYGSVLAIQLKVLWGIGRYRDITPQDNLQYFPAGAEWADRLALDLIWSPMYTAFFGTVQWFFPGALEATIFHRILIVIALSLLVLAVLRAALSPGIAWVLAVAFSLNPVIFDAYYEVHIFSALPVLVAVLVAFRWVSFRGRAVVFAILLAAAIFQRNEVVFALAAWTAVWAGYEIRQWRRGASLPGMKTVGRWVAAPAVVLLTVATIYYFEDPRSSDTFREHLSLKHNGNVCQVYAFGYQQRNPEEFAASPWTQCGQLMGREFGDEDVSLTEAVRADAGAIADHFAWNLRLAPYGAQLLLFGEMSSDDPNLIPDYCCVEQGSSLALIGTIAVLAVTSFGLVLLRRRRDHWWEDWLEQRAWGWIAFGSVAAMSVVIILTQRPRPEYLIPLGVLLLAVIGMALMAIADRWSGVGRLNAVAPLAALGLILFAPSHYDSDYVTPGHQHPGRPIDLAISRIEPFEQTVSGEGVKVLVSGPYGREVCTFSNPLDPCEGILLSEFARRPPRADPARWLGRRGIDFIYASESAMRRGRVGPPLHGLVGAGWRRLAPAPRSDQSWLFLGRVPQVRGTSS